MSQQRIPISVEILADMETPLSVFKKLGNLPYSYLFESVEGCLLYTSDAADE